MTVVTLLVLALTNLALAVALHLQNRTVRLLGRRVSDLTRRVDRWEPL